MTKLDYEEAIKTAGKFIIMVDNSQGYNEIFKVFNTPEEAHEYSSERIKHTKK